jgi:Domain of unknown function (DUF3854)
VTASSPSKTRTSRHNPCPICNKTDGCRIFENQKIWCLRSDAHTEVSGYRNLGNLRDGMGASFVSNSRSPECPCCHQEDSRCWKSKSDSVFCANHLTNSVTLVGWQFVGQSNGKSGQVWGHWCSDAPTTTETVATDDPSETSDWRPVHQWLWERASPTLRGRFISKLSDVLVSDTSYCRYLNEGAIEDIEKEVHELWRTGQWSREQIKASGWFRLNRGYDSPFRYKCALLPGRVIAYRDLDGELALLRGNAEVTPIKRKKLESGKWKAQKIKYQHPFRVPTRPYFPKSSREKLAQLEKNGTQYVLIVTEGEDKAEAAAQNCPTFSDGIPIIWVSVPGVWNFGGDDAALHPDLVKTLGCARDIVIGYDSDIQHKREVAQAMQRLSSEILEQSDGRLIPLAADWAGLFAEYPDLRTKRWGIDDLWGHLIRTDQDALAVFERLLSPHHARMVRRWWQRKGTPWKVEEQPTLLPLDEARAQTYQTISEWFDAGLTPLRSNYDDRVSVAATCGLGKTYSLGHILTNRMSSWWDGPGATETISLWQELEQLEMRKGRTLPESPDRWAVLKQIKLVRNQLSALYQRDLGGSMVVVFKDHKALSDFLADHVLPTTGYEMPPWLALRTGRELPEDDVPMREQVTPGSLACAHHEAVSELGEQRHSPSAGACQHCVWGQAGQCGFLDSLRVAHRAPVVFATIQSVLNASHELEMFEQIICDEALDIHLIETIEVAKAVRQLLGSLQRGQAGQWYTFPPLYTEEQIQALVTVFSEIVAALSRYGSATDVELKQRGHHLAAWCDAERLKPYLLLLKDLRPLRWNYDKHEVEPASYFVWERPRYKLGSSGLPLHQETYGEDQQFAFDFIPLRATTEILSDLHQTIIEGKSGAYLSLERQLTEEPSSTDPDELVSRQKVQLHMMRPQHHLIHTLRKARVLNLDATPNEIVLDAFLPDLRVVKIQAEWKETQIIQVLSGPMGRATSSTIKQILPLVVALGTQNSVLLFSHKQHLQQVDEAHAQSPIPGLLLANDAAGGEHAMGWYQYQTRGTDDEEWKKTDYLVLGGAYRTNIGHSHRVAWSLLRFMATDNHQGARQTPLENVSTYRVESYGPEGYELIVENQDPLVERLIEHERIASLEQACQRPRPVSREKPLTIILMRSDPMIAPYNRYVRVVSSIEELMGVTHPMGNRANHARHLEAITRHCEVIWHWFKEYGSLPNPRQVEEHGKTLYGVGGHRGTRSAIRQALALFASQLLPSMQANQDIAQTHSHFLEVLGHAAAEHFDINVCTAELPLSQEARNAYWLERYRQGNTHTRLVCWISTRHLGISLKQIMETIQPIYQVLNSLRSDIARRRKLSGDKNGP